jgi:hypothetical protein
MGWLKMPSKFVIRSAERTGTSIEHAEAKWAEAKKMVKKGKRRGHWYWGKVVNAFKRLMGLMEEVTFKDFLLLEGEDEDFELELIANVLHKDGFEEASSPGGAEGFIKNGWYYIASFSKGMWHLVITTEILGPQRYVYSFSDAAKVIAKIKKWDDENDAKASVDEAEKAPLVIPRSTSNNFGFKDNWLPLRFEVDPAQASRWGRLKGFNPTKDEVQQVMAEVFDGQPLSAYTVLQVRPKGTMTVMFNSDTTQPDLKILKMWGFLPVFMEGNATPKVKMSFVPLVLKPMEGKTWSTSGEAPGVLDFLNAFDHIVKDPLGSTSWFHQYDVDGHEIEDQLRNNGPIEVMIHPDANLDMKEMKDHGLEIDFFSDHSAKKNKLQPRVRK